MRRQEQMRAFTRLALCCSAAIVALSVSAALADQQIGNVVQKDFNGAKGLRVASTSADDLIFNHDIFAGETVKTHGSASTVIRFQDQTQIQVGANSSIVLDKFVYDPASGTGDAAIKFGTGVFRFITGDIKNKDAVKLTTPTTSLTIRGTKFILAITADGTTTVGVLEGVVEVTPCGGNQPTNESTGRAVQVGTNCKSHSVSLGSVTTDVTTSTDYDVSQNSTEGSAPDVGGTSDSPNNGESHGGSSSKGAGGGSNGGGGGGGGGSGGGGFGGGGGHTDH
jgi:hypothetical protein